MPVSAQTPYIRLVDDASGAHWTADETSTRGYPLPPAGYLRDVWTAAEAIYLGDDGPPDPERLAWLCHEVDDFLERIGWRSRLLFRACLLTVTWLAPILAARVPPLGRLSPEARARAIERLEESAISMPVLGLKATLSLVWFEHPRSAQEIGFDGHCQGPR